MKKLTLSLLLLACTLFAACSPAIEKNTETNQPTTETTTPKSSDTLAFKAEYEALNDDEHPHMLVPENIAIHTLNFEQTKEMLEKGTGILYFGFPTCPWCRNLLPELFAAMEESQLSDLYYYNPKAIRDKKSLNEAGEIIVETPTSEEYQYLLDKLGDILPAYEGLNDPSIKRLYVPTVVILKDGKIVGHHFNTIDEQTDPKVPLTEEQKKKLKSLISIQLFPLINETCSINKEEKPSC